MILVLLFVPVTALIVGYILLAAVTLTLASITAWRRRTRQLSALNSSLFTGRVTHTRFFPVAHAFGYPLFMACIDLDEDIHSALWPLSLVMAFRESDHYKNDEGRSGGTSLLDRTFQLINEKIKSGSAGTTSFGPTTHRVLLLTHLCYYGYCFNPVSFYYIQHRETGTMDAIVAEVSNTPWNEMQSYVLHSHSMDIKQTKESKHSINYIFSKTFHVSPFMDMDHMYDWTFGNTHDPISISTSMKKGDMIYFTAHVKLHRQGMNPNMLAWQLIKFPVYCVLIQLWIHYEAFWLFVKGVAFVPHPKGSETTASWMIGKVMTPIFDFKDWVDGMTKDKQQ